MRKLHKWSKEERGYLAEVVTGKYLKEITTLMNEKFEYQFTEMQVRGAIKRYGLKMGVSTKWQKGHVPYNKGTRGVSKANKGSYKKGNIPINAVPIGAERVHQGYTQVKVGPKKWELKQRVMYEKYHNAKLKPQDVVIFLNANKKDFSKENLYLIDRETQMYMAKNDLWSEDPELNKTAVKIAEIYKMAYKKQRGE